MVKWQGTFRGLETPRIRWATARGELVPTEAEQERQRAERLAQKLRELGVDPDTLN
ncbi:MAG: hypothetical protein ACUVRV_04815 [Cyanobacteriota bacterium]